MSAPSWIEQLAGKFIVFDGPDGSGKSTQFKRLAAYGREQGVRVCEVREPGGTPIGEDIRTILLDPQSDMSLRCEMLLYMASRAQLVDEVIKPARERGELVLADRFVSSTLAYQGTAGGLPLHEIMSVAKVAIGEQWPDLVVIFDVDEVSAARRMSGAGPTKARKGCAPPADAGPSLFADRLELRGLEYQRKVREGYLAQARENSEHYRVIDASAEADAVFKRLLAELAAWAVG